MPEADDHHTAFAATAICSTLAPDRSPAALMRAADALGDAINDMMPDGGGAIDALMAAERALEDRILALPAGDPQRLAWKLARLAEVLEADGEGTAAWQATMARSCLADARALAGRA